MHEEYNSILSTPTEADNMSRFGQYQYIGLSLLNTRSLAALVAMTQCISCKINDTWKLQSVVSPPLDDVFTPAMSNPSLHTIQ